MYEVDVKRRTVAYRAARGDYSVELPLDPMHGTVGVAPAAFEARSSLVPDSHGGNMDTPEMRAGTTCYLGVNVEGALFSLGDGHCRQGEGETCGVAVEAAMDTVVIVDLIKGVMTPWPRLENDTHVMSTGSGRPLEDAFRISQWDLTQWLASDFGLDPLDAYQLLTSGQRNARGERGGSQLHVRVEDPEGIPPQDLRLSGAQHRAAAEGAGLSGRAGLSAIGRLSIMLRPSRQGTLGPLHMHSVGRLSWAPARNAGAPAYRAFSPTDDPPGRSHAKRRARGTSNPRRRPGDPATFPISWRQGG